VCRGLTGQAGVRHWYGKKQPVNSFADVPKRHKNPPLKTSACGVSNLERDRVQFQTFRCLGWVVIQAFIQQRWLDAAEKNAYPYFNPDGTFIKNQQW